MSNVISQRIKDKQAIETALRGAGVSGGLDALKKSDFSPEIAQLLMTLFDVTFDPLVKLQIAKALASSPTGNHGEVEEFLLSRFRGASGKLHEQGMDSLAWGLANFLEVLSLGNEKLINEYISLASNSRLGPARQMIVVALAKQSKDKVEDLLIDLLDDREVVGHAVIALGKIRSKKALPKLERLAEDVNVVWIRKEIAKAISAIRTTAG